MPSVAEEVEGGDRHSQGCSRQVKENGDHAGRHAAEAQLVQDELVQLLAALDRVEPVSFELVDEADL